MNQRLLNIKGSFCRELEGADCEKVLEDLRIKYLGKKSEISQILRSLGGLPTAERSAVGKLANEVRSFLYLSIDKKEDELRRKGINNRVRCEKVDVTEPGKVFSLGNRHPLNLVIELMCKIFRSMGFSVVDGPEIETDYYNFEALNMPSYHPARDTQDTFYINSSLLLRTQTTCVQVRTLEKGKVPIRIVCPGKVFRSDNIDATHSPVFHQLEGLAVDEDVSFSDLKGTLEFFIEEFYGKGTKVRFRPHHFPYTEPSAEVDVQCFNCRGKGCRVCKNEGYIELLGCGMVHPTVLRRCGIDPKMYSGFAFGIGIERVAMKKYNIGDMRLFYENDSRFLEQFV